MPPERVVQNCSYNAATEIVQTVACSEIRNVFNYCLQAGVSGQRVCEPKSSRYMEAPGRIGIGADPLALRL